MDMIDIIIILRSASELIFKTSKMTKQPSIPNEDVLFTGYYRILAGIQDISKVRGICEHYKDDKMIKMTSKFQKLIAENL